MSEIYCAEWLDAVAPDNTLPGGRRSGTLHKRGGTIIALLSMLNALQYYNMAIPYNRNETSRDISCAANVGNYIESIKLASDAISLFSITSQD